MSSKNGSSSSHLKPPATMVSPPSPIDATINYSEIFTVPASAHTHNEPSQNAESDDAGVTYDSPDEDEEASHVEAPAQSRGTPVRPILKQKDTDPGQLTGIRFSSSPQPESSLLAPEPLRRTLSSASGSSAFSSAPSSRAASPSSPQFRMRGLHHRRTSSTHRVRETIAAEQIQMADGQRMVNQYKIGESLGKGGYATVELAIDVGTGQRYAIKEFSKSRLHLQVLQEKHKKATRGRMRGSPKPPDDDGKRKAGEDAGEGGPTREDNEGGPGPWGNQGTKTMEKDPLALIRREIAIMKKLDHPHLVSLYEAISVPKMDALFLVLEFMEGGVLMDVKFGPVVKVIEAPFSVSQTREYFRQLVLGMEYLHQNGVIHRDIKPDNILLSADREIVKLCDFGVSELFVSEVDDRIKKSGGSPAFLSPESFTSQMHEVHGKAVDIWALGITLYCMLVGGLPFNLENPIDLMRAVQTQLPPDHPEWDPNLQDLAKRMLDKNPDTRITTPEMREHPWVTADGDEPMISRDDNLFYLGSHVEEPTQHELTMAIASLRSVFTVVRAIQKFKRLGLTSRSSSSSQPPRTSTLSPPMGPTLMSSAHTSTNPSLYSGSMDSYASHYTSTTNTMPTDIEDETRTASPTPMDDSKDSSRSGTERENSPPTTRLDPIDTKKANEEAAEGADDVVVFDSPTSD